MTFYKTSDCETMAYFPKMEYNLMGCNICYASGYHHTCCSPQYAASLPLANPDENAELLAELQAVGYVSLKVLNRSARFVREHNPIIHP